MKTTVLHCAGDRARISASETSNRRARRGKGRAAVAGAVAHIVEALEPRTLLSSISGTVYSDVNLDGSRDDGDTGLSGIKVYIDLYNDKTCHTDDPQTTTASDGSYTFTGVPLDTVEKIRIVTPDTWMPASSGDADGAMLVTLTSSTPDVTGVDIGDWQPIQTLSAEDVTLTEGDTFTGKIATIVDSAGANPDLDNYSVSLSLHGVRTLDLSFDDSGNIICNPSSFPALSAGTYAGTIAATETNSGCSISASADLEVTVERGTLTTHASTITATKFESWSGTVATFTDPDPNATADKYAVLIDYGDGSESSVGTVSSDGSGGWIISGSHVFTADGTLPVSITIETSDYSTTLGTISSTANVSLAPLSLSAPTLNTEEGATVGSFATLTDPAGSSACGSYTGTLSISGTSYSGVSFTSLGGGAYSVSASGFPSLSAGTYSGTLTATETGSSTSTSATATFTINVADAPLSAAGANIGANAGVPWTGAVATFTDPDPNATAANYTATITYPDGTATGTVASDGSGGWVVTGTLTFSTPGSSSPTVVINDSGGSSTTVYASAATTFAGLSLSAPELYVEQGQSYSGNVGLLIDAAGSNSNSYDFSGSLTYDGWLYGDLSFTSAGTGQWNVVSSGLAELPAGTYSGSLSVTETIGSQSTTTGAASFTIDVISPTLYASGGYINATVGQSWSGTVASITDDDAYDVPSTYYTTATSFGDATSPSTGTISGSAGTWTIGNAHTYAAAGSFSPATTVYNLGGGSVATASSVASVNYAEISLSTSSVWLTEGQDIDATVGTLTDAAGSYSTGSYTGSLVITPSGSGSTQTDSVSFVSSGTGMYNVEVSGFSPLSAGTYTATLSASESGSGSASVNASSAFTITVADVAPTVTGASMSPTLGSSWTGTFATFTDPDPNATAGNYTATINFGDGSTGTGTVSSNGTGGWIVTATHTFADAGSLSPTVTITDNGGATATATASASVALASLSLSASEVDIQEGGTLPSTVATLTDAAGSYAVGSYTGTLSIAGAEYTATFSSVGSGVYNVSIGGTLSLAAGSYTADLAVSASVGGASVSTSTTFAINVSSSFALSGDSPTAISATQGTAFTGTLLHFTDAYASAHTGAYSTTINWGDGTTDYSTSGGISVSSDGSGGLYVAGGHTYGSNSTYTVTVTVTDAGGSSVSSSVTATVSASVPDAPSSLTATAISSGEIDLAWTNNATAYTYIEIDRALSSTGTFTPIATTIASGTSTFQDTSVSPGTTYYYEVRALNSGVASSFSSVASDTTPS